MDILEAHTTAQQLSTVLEQAYGSSRARLVLGFWATSLWPNEVRRILGDGAKISINGEEAEKLATYLSAIFRTHVSIYRSGDKLKNYRRTHTAYIGRYREKSVGIALSSGTFSPWENLGVLSQQLGEAFEVIRAQKKLLGDAHATTTIQTIDKWNPRQLYPDVVLCWAGWGALCLGRGYHEDVFPIPELPGLDRSHSAPDFDGLVQYTPNSMIILAKCCPMLDGKVKKTRFTFELTDNVLEDAYVYSIYRVSENERIFKIAEELGIEYIHEPRKPKILR